MLFQPRIFRSHGYRCAQAAMKSVLGYYSQRDLTFSELDMLTGRKRNELTYPVQIAKALLSLGVVFDYFTESGGLKGFLETDPEEEMKKIYGQYAERLIGQTNFDAVRDAVEMIYKSGKFREIEPGLADLESAISSENMPICLVNYDLLVGRDNRFNGHYLILHGFDEENLFYGDTGPVSFSQSRLIKKKRFLEIWKKMCWFDYDTVIVKPSNQFQKNSR